MKDNTPLMRTLRRTNSTSRDRLRIYIKEYRLPVKELSWTDISSACRKMIAALAVGLKLREISSAGTRGHFGIIL